MKKPIFSIIGILLGVLCGQAQDTIRFYTNDVKIAKVTEVGISEIKYKRFDNPDGPTYVSYKSEIRYIRYQNGTLESYAGAASNTPATPQPAMQIDQGYSKIQVSDIEIRGRRLVYNGRGLGESRLLRLIETYPNRDKAPILRREFEVMKSYKRTQYLSGFLGLGLGVGAAYVGMMSALFTDSEAPLFSGIAVGGAIGISGTVISSIYKSKRERKKIEIARMYNEFN